MFDVLYADPPWRYDNQQQNDPARGGVTYPTMSMKELADLPVRDIVADNAIMFFWVTMPKLLDSVYEHPNPLEIIHAWGFRPVTRAFLWVKTNRLGAAVSDEDNLEEYPSFYSGLGRYTNGNPEDCILCRRGRGLERHAKNIKELLIHPIGRHSAKPQEVYKRIDAMYPQANKLELFARRDNVPDGLRQWTHTGLDYDGVRVEDFINEVIAGRLS